MASARTLGGRKILFSGYYKIQIRGWRQARRFAELIGFRVSYRRERLEFLLELEKYPPSERYQLWTQRYGKRNGRWVPRAGAQEENKN